MLDILFAITILFAVIKGLRKGLIIALFSIIAIIVGIAAAMKLSTFVAGLLEKHANGMERWLPFISFILVMLLVILGVNLIGKIVEKMVEIALMGWLNRIGGVVFYVLLYSLLFSVALFYVEKLHLINNETIEGSSVVHYIRPWAPKVINGLGYIVPFFKNMFSELEHFFEQIPHKSTI